MSCIYYSCVFECAFNFWIGLLVIGATNVPERIDAALLRPGRFDRVLFVDLPSEPDRLEILEIHARGMPLAGDVDLQEIGRDSPYCSGAELEVRLFMFSLR